MNCYAHKNIEGNLASPGLTLCQDATVQCKMVPRVPKGYYNGELRTGRQWLQGPKSKVNFVDMPVVRYFL